MGVAVNAAHLAQLAHRALVAAVVLGVTAPRRKHVTIAAGEMAALAGADTSADLVVVLDAAVVAEADLATAIAGLRTQLGDGEAVALVVASPVILAPSTPTPMPTPERDDAYAQATAWASTRGSGTASAPPFDPSRLERIIELMELRGLLLVEPEIGLVAPGLGRVRGMRSARARALLATVALGASARPLLFVPTARAPKGGLARAKVERLADGWVSARDELEPSADESPLVRAALRVLGDAARATSGPIAFKELLREARDRWSATARASGTRATQSAGDTPELAASLYRLSAEERVDLWLLDPAAPAWTLTSH